MYEDSALSLPVTAAPRRWQTSASPLIPAPPMAMKWSFLRLQSVIGEQFTSSARRQHFSRDSLRRIGAGEGARRGRHAPEPAGVGQQLSRGSRQSLR
jgi:hypothetical protein